MNKYDLLEAFLLNFLETQVKKTGFSNVILGLSGGLDSSVVAVLLSKIFHKNLTAILMPSLTSSESSLVDAKALCSSFDINYEIYPIGNLVEQYFKDKQRQNLRIGNFAARMRMATLYDISSQKNALVIGTSNKSELALGYGTLYGDLACAINPIGDIYKSDLFDFAKHLHVNDSIIQKAPSADLWAGQKDEDELGFNYEQIDNVLRDFLDNNLDYEQLIKKGHSEQLVKMIQNRFYKNQFKRRLPIIAELNICENYKIKEQ